MKNTERLLPVDVSTGESTGDTPDDNIENGDEGEVVEEMMPMPFGVLSISFLCNALQFSAYLGLSMLILILISIFRPQ